MLSKSYVICVIVPLDGVVMSGHVPLDRVVMSGHVSLDGVVM